MYSWDFVGLSLMLSGIGFTLLQMMSDRSHPPPACSANATRHGIPMKSFCLKPGTTVRFGFGPSLILPLGFIGSVVFVVLGPCGTVQYESPRLHQTTPSVRSTRRTSRNTSTRCWTNNSGTGSSPSAPRQPSPQTRSWSPWYERRPQYGGLVTQQCTDASGIARSTSSTWPTRESTVGELTASDPRPPD